MNALTASAKAYLDELAADIVANGGFSEGESVEDAMISAHARRQEFAMEMATGETDRSKKVRKAMSVVIYTSLRA